MNKDILHGILDCLAVIETNYDIPLVIEFVIQEYQITKSELEFFKQEWFYEYLSKFLKENK